MISVNDLMLGDWVKVKPNPYMHTYDLDKSNYDPETHPYLIVKVEQLSDYGINPIECWGDILWTVEAEIDGIELTPEIFKANGFTELSTINQGLQPGTLGYIDNFRGLLSDASRSY
jgi:hypothetical protein